MSVRSPRVTVAMPVHNGERYLGESIRSVLAQTFEDFEIIVCDNASGDGTADIVHGFRDPRITYRRNAKNIGLLGNLILAVEQGRAPYVQVWHHDDVMLPANLEQKVRCLDSDAAIGLVHSNVIIIDSAGVVVKEHWAEESRRDYVEEGQAWLARTVESFNPVCAPAALVRRAVYEQLGSYRRDLVYTHDFEMWMRIAVFHKIACLGTPLIKYRVHDAMSSQSFQGPRDLEQEYRARRMLFAEHGRRIPRVVCARAGAALAERARDLTWGALLRGDYPEARAYARTMLRARPSLLRSRICWSLLLRVAAGAAGNRLYQRLAGRRVS